MRPQRRWRVNGILMVGALSCLGLIGCRTAGHQHRDVAADEAMRDVSAPSSAAEPLTGSQQPQPGFQQEPPKAQSP